MKVHRFVTPFAYVNIEMPAWLAFFFKRWARVTVKKLSDELEGASLGVVAFDEAQDVPAERE